MHHQTALSLFLFKRTGGENTTEQSPWVYIWKGRSLTKYCHRQNRGKIFRNINVIYCQQTRKVKRASPTHSFNSASLISEGELELDDLPTQTILWCYEWGCGLSIMLCLFHCFMVTLCPCSMSLCHEMSSFLNWSYSELPTDCNSPSTAPVRLCTTGLTPQKLLQISSMDGSSPSPPAPPWTPLHSLQL